VTITDRMAAWRRERRVLQRVSRAAWRLEQAERERAWALASARAEGVSIRTLAAAAGLVSARVHQITAGAPCGRDRGDRVGAGMVVLQTGGAVRWHPGHHQRRYRRRGASVAGGLGYQIDVNERQ